MATSAAPAAPCRGALLALLAVVGASVVLHDVDAFGAAGRQRRQLRGPRLLNSVSTAASRVGGDLVKGASAAIGEPLMDTVNRVAGALPVVNETVDALADLLITATLFVSAGDDEGVRLKPSDCPSVLASGFDASRPTKVITHGYIGNSAQGTGFHLMKDAMLEQGDFNVILYNWQLFDSKVYLLSATTSVDAVGRKIARDLAALSACAGLRPRDLNLVGHSLGAHIMGWAAENLAAALGEQVQIVTGLDAAGPFFSNTSTPLKINAGQAEFVYNIHTDGGVLGMEAPTAALDIFFNGGQHPQPLCPVDLIGTCSHCFVLEVYLQALLHPRGFIAKKCSSWDDFLAHHCEFGHQSELGLGVDKTARGSYYIASDLSPERWLSMCADKYVMFPVNVLNDTVSGIVDVL